MGYIFRVKWIVRAPRDLEKMLRRLPKGVGSLFDALLADLENEGPFPRGWTIGHLSGEWKGYLKAKLKRDYRVVYRYESNVITICIEKVGNRRDVYRR